MKPGPAMSTFVNHRVGAKFRGQRIGQVARLFAGVLGEHHRGVGRHVAVRGIARRLDHDARKIDALRQHAVGDQRLVRREHALEHVGEQILRVVFGGHRRQFARCGAG